MRNRSVSKKENMKKDNPRKNLRILPLGKLLDKRRLRGWKCTSAKFPPSKKRTTHSCREIVSAHYPPSQKDEPRCCAPLKIHGHHTHVHVMVAGWVVHVHGHRAFQLRDVAQSVWGGALDNPSLYIRTFLFYPYLSIYPFLVFFV